LIPAILNVINNAIMASAKQQQKKIAIKGDIVGHQLHLVIRDFGKGFAAEHFGQLGLVPVPSTQGLGMAMFLTNASFERLGVTLALSNHQQGGAQVSIALPLLTLNDAEDRTTHVAINH
jgi:two-component system sensor histidine kinase RegB